MRYQCALIAVQDLEKSKAFYQDVMGQKITLDLGDNIAFGDGLALQRNYEGLLGVADFAIAHGGNDHELYFEETDYDAFEQRIARFEDIEYLHRTKEYGWGQRVMRFYDPDRHIIEVGESMKSVFLRFAKEGMTPEQVAQRTMHPVDYVQKTLFEA